MARCARRRPASPAIVAAEALADPFEPEPERRGINSIQLFRDPDKGWRIVAMIRVNEREGVSIPDAIEAPGFES